MRRRQRWGLIGLVVFRVHAGLLGFGVYATHTLWVSVHNHTGQGPCPKALNLDSQQRITTFVHGKTQTIWEDTNYIHINRSGDCYMLLLSSQIHVCVDKQTCVLKSTTTFNMCMQYMCIHIYRCLHVYVYIYMYIDTYV